LTCRHFNEEAERQGFRAEVVKDEGFSIKSLKRPRLLATLEWLGCGDASVLMARRRSSGQGTARSTWMTSTPKADDARYYEDVDRLVATNASTASATRRACPFVAC
jgi:hypothetical protein